MKVYRVVIIRDLGDDGQLAKRLQYYLMMKERISEEDLDFLNEGFRLAGEGRVAQALEAFEMAAQRNTLCAPAAYLHRGVIYYDLKQLARAEEEYKRVLELVPFNSKASYFLHGLYYERANVREAIAEGIRFFSGRKSKEENELISDYRQSLENLLCWSDEEFEQTHLCIFEEIPKTKLSTCRSDDEGSIL